ncbi:hypothetical protein [Actinoplanes xinjiangensis]|uniref:hypothetical protein n=1 Tax=Actinoplanes xinjiangensis TaxID=512350 RepID=UPI003426D7AD
MQLAHAGGWRLALIPHADGEDSCYRLCRDRVWAGDCPGPQLADLMDGHGLVFDDFTTANIDCCVMVDPSTHVTCLRPAEPVDGQNHLPLCGMCRQTLTRMHGFPRPKGLQAPAPALAHLSMLWHDTGAGHHQRELSHHLRHPSPRSSAGPRSCTTTTPCPPPRPGSCMSSTKPLETCNDYSTPPPRHRDRRPAAVLPHLRRDRATLLPFCTAQDSPFAAEVANMPEQAFLLANIVIKFAYASITVAILVPVSRAGQLRTNKLAVATSMIFFSCAVGHALYAIMAYRPGLGDRVECVNGPSPLILDT